MLIRFFAIAHNNSLCLGINHLNSNRLDSWNSGCNLTGKDSSPVINRSLPNKQSLSHFGNLSVKCGHNVGQGLDEGDLTSECGVNIRELESNVSRADDGNPFGDRLKFECSVGGVNGFFVDSDTRGYKWDGTWGEDDVLWLLC